MYWSYNKKTNEPAYLTSMKKVSVFTGIKYDALAHKFGRNNETEFENDQFYVQKCNTPEDAMVAFAGRMVKSLNVQYVGDFKGTQDGKEISLKIYTANEIEKSS